MLDELFHGLDDGVRVDPSRVQQLRGLARRRHVAHGEVAIRELRAGQGREHGGAKPAFGPMILRDHQAATRRVDGCGEGLRVYRLHRIRVDDPYRYTVSRKRVRSLDGLVKRDARRDDGHLVIGATATYDL